ncbi:type II secretion system protein GspM [Paracidovorax valerianellae]|uniref:type II secretion system protein GspM n=1 Tax=Paracidovorax valerianellae TaxID=187868 RepID=UPI0023049521|nr:type II secretion system protein GspM [Paracidovorax valerianellae]MDA8447771.1 type II secretion system protein M [Paracidovorax valerianellae]
MKRPSSSAASASPSASGIAPLRARWKALAPREQSLVLAAVGLVAAALLWWVAIAPALQTLRSAPARHAELDAQLQHMQSLQAEALQLQSAPRPPLGDTAQALRSSLTQRLGTTAQMSVLGDRATVTLKGAPADALALWLSQARSNARTVPIEARLARSSTAVVGPTSANKPPAALSNQPAAPDMPRWDGTLVLALPSG